MKKAITVAPVLVALFALAGWQETARAAEKAKDGAAKGGGVEATIMQLNDKLTAATLKGDVATFDALLADDYVSISALTGATNTKAEVINSFKSGKMKYESLDVSDVKVRVLGPTTALVTAKGEVKGKFGDQDMSGSYRASRLFVKRGGKWQAVFFHSTKIATQARTG